MSQIAKDTPGVDHVIGFTGLSVQGFVNLSNAAVCFFPLKPFEERTTKELSGRRIAGALNKKFGTIQDAVIFAVPPPPVQGLGNTGGFKLYHPGSRRARLRRARARDRRGAQQGAAAAPSSIRTRRTRRFQNSVPQLFADVDRVKAKRQGVPLSNVFDTLQAYLGSVYINDFNRFGRTYRVYAQAEAPLSQQAGGHRRLEDAQPARRHGADGRAWPTCASNPVPDRVSHYNVYLASDINSQGAPGVLLGPGHRRHGAGAERNAAERLRLRMDRPHLPAEERRQHRADRVSDLRHAGVPDSLRAVRELGAAAGGDPHRAHVPAVRHGRACGSRARTTTC